MSTRWTELRLVVPRAKATALSRLAFEQGASGVQEAEPPGVKPALRQPWDTEDPPQHPDCTLITWLPAEAAEAAALALERASGVEVSRAPVVEEDWSESWKRHHHAVAVSERLRVAPPWEALPGDLVIPPGNAFGTGDHPTTRACLEAIDRFAGPGRCLDVGCGSGVLALAAAKLGMAAVGVDIDRDSVAAARENAALNGLTADFSQAPLASLSGRYELVVANLYAEVLATMAADLRRLTGGRLVLAGILEDRAHLVLAALEGMPLLERRQDGEWVSLQLGPAAP
jgi:ribosomal protein L11 methyltransferase